MHFDHVALATRDSLPVLNTLVGDLGGTVLQGAIRPGSSRCSCASATPTEA